jgi:hypothetical protein
LRPDRKIPSGHPSDGRPLDVCETHTPWTLGQWSLRIGYLPESFPLFDALTRALSLARERLTRRQFEPLGRWTLMHIDRNGELQTGTVDVLEAMPMERLILVRQGPGAEPQVIKMGRIVEAIDVPTGRKVVLDRWLAYVVAGNSANKQTARAQA